jgi:hypothetical protein
MEARRRNCGGNPPGAGRRYARASPGPPSGILALWLLDMDERKLFWGIVTILSLLADFTLPLMWGLVATIPIVFLSWWIVYRSEWF